MNIIKLFFIFLFIIFPFNLAISGGHYPPEKHYQKEWCKNAGGITEYILDDKTRVDCLTDEYAIEFDFAHKWAESVGQALYYALKTNRQPGIVLILKDTVKDKKYLLRLRLVADYYKIKIWTIPND